MDKSTNHYHILAFTVINVFSALALSDVNFEKGIHTGKYQAIFYNSAMKKKKST
jgi:hypothetical protein